MLYIFIACVMIVITYQSPPSCYFHVGFIDDILVFNCELKSQKNTRYINHYNS